MFSREEIQTLAEGLDSLARNSKDVILAAARLLPIRNKLEEMARTQQSHPVASEDGRSSR